MNKNQVHFHAKARETLIYGTVEMLSDRSKSVRKQAHDKVFFVFSLASGDKHQRKQREKRRDGLVCKSSMRELHSRILQSSIKAESKNSSLFFGFLDRISRDVGLHSD